MKITVNNKQKQLADEAIERACEKINAAFSKFGDDVISVELTAEDVNGPRGGVDKECRLLVRLRKMDDAMATVREESFTKAISRAINRAQRSVTRKIQRRSLRNSDRKSTLSFAVYR
jgi:ribosome-associated translation inhibitor RaiA